MTLEQGNIVTIRLSAAAYAALMIELAFAAGIADRDILAHSRSNAEALLKELNRQGQAGSDQ